MQKSETTLNVPASFCFPPFYEREAHVTFSDAGTAGREQPFFYDILFIEKPSSLSSWPWEDPLRDFNRSWPDRRAGIAEAFRSRDRKRAEKPMIQALALFIDQAVWSSGRAVDSLSPQHLMKTVASLPYAPLNIEGRLSYIIKQPDHYLSFIQLNQLDEELKKKLAVYKKKG
ncbi:MULTISPECIES: YpoC family protein [unclassified Sporolactobacillus]|uniref:YpoC family protein n=1 Tax=unclassified Sporolactobacillus TaxID=2628533 RepID=UPI002368C461|nr:hypothetical protein [Sporolactobacillus sp. CQH2019]MDD9148733.1 hypothetical protein [Sporolactobacillus sp. CQH2019]